MVYPGWQSAIKRPRIGARIKARGYRGIRCRAEPGKKKGAAGEWRKAGGIGTQGGGVGVSREVT